LPDKDVIAGKLVQAAQLVDGYPGDESDTQQGIPLLNSVDDPAIWARRRRRERSKLEKRRGQDAFLPNMPGSGQCQFERHQQGQYAQTGKKMSADHGLIIMQTF